MIGKALRLMLTATAALASGGCALLGFGYDRGPARPEVRDPAPIVSGTMRPYQIRGRWYHPVDDPDYEEVGLASWYGDRFHGRPTATGETFDMNALTAAHKTLPLPGLVEGRIIDLSRAAAQELGLLDQGVGRVRVRYLGRAPRLHERRAAAQAAVEVLARVAPAAQEAVDF